MPAQLRARFAEDELGPEGFARLVGTLDPALCAPLLDRLSPGFLAEVAVAGGPRRLAALARLVPAEQIPEVIAHLDRRDEHATARAFARAAGRRA